MRITGICAGAAAGLLLAACATEPNDALQGPYVLVSVNGALVPIVADSSGGTTQWLVSKTLLFDGRGRVTQVLSWRRDSVTTGEAQVTSSEFQYQVRGDSVVIGSLAICPPNSNCLANVPGLISAGRLTLDPDGRREVYHSP